jgi:hypothetical protein
VLTQDGLLGRLGRGRLKNPATPEISVIVKGGHAGGQNETLFEDFHRASSWMAL